MGVSENENLEQQASGVAAIEILRGSLTMQVKIKS